jgi:hypothetical protein
MIKNLTDEELIELGRADKEPLTQELARRLEFRDGQVTGLLVRTGDITFVPSLLKQQAG